MADARGGRVGNLKVMEVFAKPGKRKQNVPSLRWASYRFRALPFPLLNWVAAFLHKGFGPAYVGDGMLLDLGVRLRLGADGISSHVGDDKLEAK